LAAPPPRSADKARSAKGICGGNENRHPKFTLRAALRDTTRVIGGDECLHNTKRINSDIRAKDGAEGLHNVKLASWEIRWFEGRLGGGAHARMKNLIGGCLKSWRLAME
jgi:hypothetical protein